jgi:hypothetical protein
MPPDREDLAEHVAQGASLDSRLLSDYASGLECAADRAEAAAVAAGPEASAVDRFEAGLQALLSAAAEQPDLARLCLVEAPGLGARALERKDAGMQRFVDWLRHDVAPGEGALSGLAAEMVVGGIYEVLQRKARVEDVARLPELADELRQLWLPVLRGASAR